MRLSVFYNHIQEAAQQKNIPEEEVLEKVKSYGIDYCELDFNGIEKSDDILKKLSDAKMKVSSVYCFYSFNIEDESKKIQNHIARAKDCGSKNIMIIPGFYAGPNHDPEDKIFIEGTRRVCESAVKENITPLVEDFDDSKSPVATIQQLRKFFDKIPELRFAFDSGNFMYSKESEIEAFETLRDMISHVHCKDRSLKSSEGGEEKLCIDGTKMYPAAVGFGEIKFTEIISRLLNESYSGIFTIEHFGTKDQMGYMKKSADFLKSFGK